MANYIESAKTYTGNDLETIFFRPMLSGESAEQLGVRVLYNMPTPTTVQLWSSNSNVLQKFDGAGWSGGSAAIKEQKTIDMHRVKAEMGFSAADYFSLIFERITNRADVNMGDLTGSELEQAETALFKSAIAESIRATMWVGDTESDGYNTFNGFLKSIVQGVEDGEVSVVHTFKRDEMIYADKSYSIIEKLWEAAPAALRGLKAQGQLAFYVSSDIYHMYEKYLDSMGVNDAYLGMIDGRHALCYHGIPIIDTNITSYVEETSLPQSYCFLTDRRNLVLAVNTADFPGTEVRMWYNPDEMENRQRAVFMAGCEVIDHNLVAFAHVIE